MAHPGPSAELPEPWADLRALVDAAAAAGQVRLYRWEEQFTEAGERRCAAHLLPGPFELEALAPHVVARAVELGIAAHEVTIATRQLPARLVVTRIEPRAWGGGMRVVPSPPPSEWSRDPTLLPRVAALLALASRVAPTKVACVDRFAELDPDPSRGGRFAPPTLRALLRGPFVLAAMCELLAAEGYEEDGDAWVKETPEGREEVRLHDGELDLAWVPSELAGASVAPLSKSTRPPPVA